MNLNIFYLLVILFLCSFLSGYVLGRKKGKKEGVLEGELYAPLQLRIRGLEKGRCQICGTRTIKKLKTTPYFKHSKSI